MLMDALMGVLMRLLSLKKPKGFFNPPN